MDRNNVKAEMARFGLTIARMAYLMGMTSSTFSQKLNGKKDWTGKEVFKLEIIFNHYGANVTWIDLFGDLYQDAKAEYLRDNLIEVGK